MFDTSSHMRDAPDWSPPDEVIDLRVEYLCRFGKPDRPLTAELVAPHVDEILANINVDEALARGRYVVACARIERRGVPVDADLYERLNANRGAVLATMAADVVKLYGDVLRPDGDIDHAAFVRACKERGMPRPAGPKAVQWRDYASSCVWGRPAAEYKSTYRHLRKPLRLNTGPDGRARAALNPFGAITGRCAPSSTGYVFSLPKWLRGLVRPNPGRALVILDYKAEEPGIAAALSGDQNLLEAYASGDFYRYAAMLCGRDAKEYKAAFNSLQYGSRAFGLAERLCVAYETAAEIVDKHTSSFARFFEWLDEKRATLDARGVARSPHGWCARAKGRTLDNFWLQGAAADLLRDVVVELDELGYEVIATNHDSVVVECDEAERQDVLRKVRSVMVRASERMLGMPLMVESDVIVPPGRYLTEKTAKTWERVVTTLDVSSGSGVCFSQPDTGPYWLEREGSYLVGVPWWWVLRLGGNPLLYRLSLALWYRHGLRYWEPLPVSNVLVKPFNVHDVEAKRKGVEELEAAGLLVRLPDDAPNRCPRVTLPVKGHEFGRHYLGLIDLAWVHRLCHLPGGLATLKVGLVTWYRWSFLRRPDDFFELDKKDLDALGVGTVAKAKGLKELEQAGLISRKGKRIRMDGAKVG